MPQAVAPRWAAWIQRSSNLPGPTSAPSSVGAPPDPVLIPFSWISYPINRKPTTAVTKAQVTQSGGITSFSTVAAAQVRQYGVNTAQVTLDTACDADPINLAAMFTTYQGTPRPRQPLLTFNLINRTDAECGVILGVGLTRRVRITGAPTSQPPGDLNFTVEGIRHFITVEERTVTWSTAALIGTTTTAPGPWFRLGYSLLGGSDLVPF